MKKRLLIKLSGELLAGTKAGKANYDITAIDAIVKDIKSAQELGFEIAIVIGGGNIMRGRDLEDTISNKPVRDSIGIMSTVMNAIFLEEYFNNKGIKAKAQSSKKIDSIIDEFNMRKAKSYISDGWVMIFAGGTGNPFVSTDTAAVIRALELDANLLLKATKSDGVYDKNPDLYKDAKHISKISYDEIIKNKLLIMDPASILIAKENELKIKIFSMKKEGGLMNVLKDTGNFTVIE